MSAMPLEKRLLPARDDAGALPETVRTWGGLLDRRDVLIVGCAATGLGGKAEVVEVALADTTGATRLNRLVMPAGDWGESAEKAEQIHGHSLERLMDRGMPWPSIHDEIELLMREAGVVIGWNVSFDIRLLGQTASAWDRELPRVLAHDAWRAWGGGKLDSVPGVRRAAHRALGDARAVLALMRRNPGILVQDLTKGSR